jgi:hypothetical protein
LVEGASAEMITGLALTVSVKINASTFCQDSILITVMNPKNESQLNVPFFERRNKN